MARNLIMEIHQLRYFLALAKSHSFTKAARQEHVSQPSLSRQISKLEGELNTKLFERLGRSVRLTTFGELYLPKVQSILGQLDEATSQVREMASNEGGRVTLGVIPTITPFFLPSLLARFLERYPNVEIKVVEETAPILLGMLREGTLNFVLTPLPVSEKGLDSTELMRERLYAVVPEAHGLAKREAINLRELAGAPFLILKDAHCFRESVGSAFQRQKFQPNIVFETGCFLTILNMVSAGIGVSVVPEMAVSVVERCCFVPIRDKRPIRVIGLVQQRSRVLTRAQRVFVEFIKKEDSKGASAGNAFRNK